jgi:hypothetical protein
MRSILHYAALLTVFLPAMAKDIVRYQHLKTPRAGDIAGNVEG